MVDQIARQTNFPSMILLADRHPPGGIMLRHIKDRTLPSLIAHLLESDAFNLVSRIILTSFFWVAGLVGQFSPSLIVAAVSRAALPFPRLIAGAMIITELAGSALLITDLGSLGWLGAGWLGVFAALSTPLGHPFWRFDPPRKMEEFQVALEHVAVVGGLMCETALTLR